MHWYFFALISILSISVANLFQRLAMKRQDSNPVISSIVFQFLVTIVTGIFALLKGFKFPPISLLPFILMGSIIYAFGTLFMFKAIKKIEASELSIITGFGSVATIISAFLFLNERLRLIQLLGVIFIITAVLIINKVKRGIILNKGFLFALLGTSLYGVAVTNDAFILKTYDAVSYTPVISFIPGLILCVIYFSKIKSVLFNLTKSFEIRLGIYSTLYGIQAITYYLALENGALASQMSPIFRTEVILTVLLAAIFLKERKNLLRKFLAMTIALIGAFLIL